MKRVLAAALCGFCAFSSSAFAAGDKGTAEEAVALVKKVAATINAEGKDKTFAAITSKDPRFVDRDLYALVFDLDANCLAHGSNPKLVGRNTIDTQDTDGKFFIKERVELGKKGQPFWQDYKFSNPVTKMIEPKSAYCERKDDYLICAGIYK